MRPRLRKIVRLVGYEPPPPPRRISPGELRSADELKRRLDATRERLRSETPQRRDAA